jgi:drug/metabolite transporter (DMT)-like permease
MFDVQTKGIIWFILHCLYFSLIAVITKHLMQHLHIFEIVFFQTALGSLVLFLVIQVKFKEHFQIHQVSLHAWRALLWVLATVIYFYALHYIPLAKAVGVSFSVPLFTTVLAMLWLRERFYVARGIALLLGIAGMWIIIQPGVEGYQPEALWVVAASFLWSITDIMIKILGRNHHAVVKTFYFAVFSAVFTLPVALHYWVMPDMGDVLWLVLLAIIFSANIVAISKSYQQADLTVLMPFTFTQLLFSAGIAYLVFGEVMSLNTLVGGVIIVSSTSYMAYLERKKRLLSS